jgi:hypothetical protein
MRFLVYTGFFYLGDLAETAVDVWDRIDDLVVTVRICLRRGLG